MFIHFHPFSSIFIHFHPFSSIFIHFHQGSREPRDTKNTNWDGVRTASIKVGFNRFYLHCIAFHIWNCRLMGWSVSSICTPFFKVITLMKVVDCFWVAHWKIGQVGVGFWTRQRSSSQLMLQPSHFSWIGGRHFLLEWERVGFDIVDDVSSSCSSSKVEKGMLLLHVVKCIQHVPYVHATREL